MLEKHNFSFRKVGESGLYSYNFYNDVKVGVVSEVNVYYRQHGESLSTLKNTVGKVELSYPQIAEAIEADWARPIGDEYKRMLFNIFKFRISYSLVSISMIKTGMGELKRYDHALREGYKFNIISYCRSILNFETYGKILMTISVLRINRLLIITLRVILYLRENLRYSPREGLSRLGLTCRVRKIS